MNKEKGLERLNKLKELSVEIDLKIKLRKKELLHRYFSASEKLRKDGLGASAAKDIQREKMLIREDLDALRDFSRAGITQDSVVTQASNRAISKDDDSQKDDYLLQIIDELEQRNNSTVE